MALGDLVVKLSADIAQFQSDMGRAVHQAQQTGQKIERAFSNVGRVLGLGLAGISFGNLFGQAVTQAKEAEDAIHRMTATLRATEHAAGLTKDQLDGMAESLSKSTQFDNTSIRNAASQLLIFKNIQGETFKETLKLSADVAAYFGIGIPEAAQMLGRSIEDVDQAFGLLRRRGVSLGEQQKDNIKKMGELGDKAGQQAVVLGKLKGAFGGVAAEMNTGLSGALTTAKKEFNEMLETIGKSPIVGGLVEKFMIGLAKSFRELKENLSITTTELQNFYSTAMKVASVKLFSLGSIGAPLAAVTGLLGKLSETQPDAKRQPIQPIKGSPFSKEGVRAAGEEKQRLLQLADAAYVAQKKAAEEAKKAGDIFKRAYDSQVEGLNSIIERELEYNNIQKVTADIAAGKFGKLSEPRQQELISLAARADMLKQNADLEKDLAEISKKAADDALNDAIKKADEYRSTMDKLISPTLTARADALQESVDFLNKAFDSGHRNPVLYKQAIDHVTGAADALKQKTEALSSAIEGLISQTAIERAKKMQETLDEMNRRTEGELIHPSVRDQAVDVFFDIEKAAKKTNDVMHDLGLTFSSMFEDALVDGKKFSELIAGLEKDILRIGTRKLVTEPLTDWFSNVLKPSDSGSKGGSSSGGFGDIISGAGDWIKDLFSGGFPSFAVGASYVPRDMVAQIHKGETIIPAGQGNGMMAGPTIIMNISTPDANSFRASRGQIVGDMAAALSASRRNR